MKKAKFMLMGVAIIGIAGGALAFKAKNFGNTIPTFSVCDVSPTPHICDLGEVDKVNYTTSFISGAATITVTATTANPVCTTNADCKIPALTLYFSN
jgi:hypothetical protein